jgi:hypothetical protein
LERYDARKLYTAMTSIPVLIIPVLNRYDLLDSLLESINYPIDNILVIDNGGSYKKYKHNLLVLNIPTNLNYKIIR